ncbi:unnamed protein product [Clonostachys byssicola]|uniref:N-acetyltransferase domain-containing protein n=1 Tax=Clonostachys byssicola TaxID=160290 RepID=A0A9N9U8J4_9HYPO|nr:unnamed protein product [Clonostachys byssicola]
MRLKVRAAVLSDIPNLMEIYFVAFKNDLDRLYFPDTPQNRLCWTKELQDDIVDPDQQIQVAIDSSNGAEAIIAWAQWVCYDAEEVAVKPTYLDEQYWVEGSVAKSPEMEYELSPDVEASTVLDYLTEQWATHARNAPRDHWYLEIIATDPNHQRRGAGSFLLEEGLIRVDKMGLEVYLEGSPMAVPLYKRFGFEEKASITFTSPVQTRHQIIMLREPVQE